MPKEESQEAIWLLTMTIIRDSATKLTKKHHKNIKSLLRIDDCQSDNGTQN